MIEIEQTKQYLQEEYKKGNKIPYKKILNYCMGLYRKDNKEKVKEYNKRYKINLRLSKQEKKINLPQTDDKKKINLPNNTHTQQDNNLNIF